VTERDWPWAGLVPELGRTASLEGRGPGGRSPMAPPVVGSGELAAITTLAASASGSTPPPEPADPYDAAMAYRAHRARIRGLVATLYARPLSVLEWWQRWGPLV